jgi:dienelactone hydrolase
MPTRDQAIEVAIGDGHIAGTLIMPGTRIPGVLFVHGWGGSQQQYLARAREVAALGCACLTFDLRGHAETRLQYEAVSREQNLADVVAAYDVIAGNPNVDSSAIAVVGSSYGGYLAAVLTSMRTVKWLALRACLEFQGDVLVIESENDGVIPHTVITSYVEACTRAHSLTYRMIQGADHGLSDEASQRSYTSLLVNWMTEMVQGARVGDKGAPTDATQSTPQRSA